MLLKNYISLILSVLLVATLVCSCGDDPQPYVRPSSEEIALDLTAIISELSATDLSIDDSELAILSTLGKASIVGLGEATHNTKDFFLLKHRIFKYLVENHGFRIFAIEADMGESYYIDRYITSGQGDLDEIMLDTMQFWVWRTEEIKSMLEWMKEFNLGRTESDQIRYFGIDCQYTRHTAFLSKEFLLAKIPQFTSEIENLYSDLDSLNNGRFSSLSNEEKFRIKSKIDSIEELFINNSTQISTNSTAFEFVYYERMILQMQQVYHVLNTSNSQFKFNRRDLAMANNTMWLKELPGQDHKIGLWAHNGHIWDTNYDGWENMGYHLNNSLETDDYQSVLFHFSYGGFNAWGFNVDELADSTELNEIIYFEDIVAFDLTSDPLKNSLNEVCSIVPVDNFIFRTDNTDTDRLKTWLSTRLSSIQIGSIYSTEHEDDYYYNSHVPKRATDFNIYVNRTIAATRLE